MDVALEKVPKAELPKVQRARPQWGTRQSLRQKDRV